MYGTGGDVTDWETTLPTKAWDLEVPTVGGSRTSAGGTPAGYVVRRDHNVRVVLRLYESELSHVGSLVEWGQLSESFLWFPDANDTGTNYLVYLEDPVAGEPLTPVRDPEFPRVFEVEMVLRRVAGTFLDLVFYPSC